MAGRFDLLNDPRGLFADQERQLIESQRQRAASLLGVPVSEIRDVFTEVPGVGGGASGRAIANPALRDFLESESKRFGGTEGGTGAMVADFLIRQGTPPEQAIQRAQQLTGADVRNTGGFGINQALGIGSVLAGPLAASLAGFGPLAGAAGAGGAGAIEAGTGALSTGGVGGATGLTSGGLTAGGGLLGGGGAAAGGAAAGAGSGLLDFLGNAGPAVGAIGGGLLGGISSALAPDELTATTGPVPGQPLLGSAQQQLQSTLAGDFLTGGPGFDAAFTAARNRILPDVRSRFALAGRTGSGLAQAAETQALADAFAGLVERERNRQVTAASLAPGLLQQQQAQPLFNSPLQSALGGALAGGQLFNLLGGGGG